MDPTKIDRGLLGRIWNGNGCFNPAEEGPLEMAVAEKLFVDHMLRRADGKLLITSLGAAKATEPVTDEVPDWIVGFMVDWMNSYSNAPGIKLIVTDYPDPKMRWIEGPASLEPRSLGMRLYSGFSEDGIMMRQLSHYGLTSQRADGVWQTGKADGFAGREVGIRMADGRRASLRGPFFAETNHPEFLTLTTIIPQDLISGQGGLYGLSFRKSVVMKVLTCSPLTPVEDRIYRTTFAKDDPARVDRNDADIFFIPGRTPTEFMPGEQAKN